VTISEDITLRTDISYEIIGKLKGQHLLLLDKENSFFIHAFDEELKMTWEKELELEKRRPEILGTVTKGSDFFIAYQHRWKGETIIKMHQYDAGANLLDTATVKNFGFMFTTPNFQIIRSEDRSKVLLFNEETDGKIQAVSFDLKQMKTLWYVEFQPENLFFSRDQSQIVVDNKGKMYFIVLKSNFRSKSKEHHYEIFHYDGLTKSVGTYKVPVQGKLTYDVYFECDNLNNQLVAGGLYGEKNLAWARGYFLLKIPEDNPSDHRIYFHEFDDELVVNYLEKDAPSKNKGIFETNIQELVLRRDGGILMITERVKTSQRNYGTATASSYYSRSLGNVVGLTDYYYDHMLVLSIHPDGKQHWANVLRKKQYSQDDNAAFSSYFLLKTPGSLHFIFNDEIKEENTVSEYNVQGNGNFERNSVMSTERQRLRLRFQEAVQIGTREFLVPSERRNRLKLVRVQFEK
ncbi:MAG: hypothetical protein AAFO82_03395, partial [Bacteroidota bacterium]